MVLPSCLINNSGNSAGFPVKDVNPFNGGNNCASPAGIKDVLDKIGLLSVSRRSYGHKYIYTDIMFCRQTLDR